MPEHLALYLFMIILKSSLYFCVEAYKFVNIKSRKNAYYQFYIIKIIGTQVYFCKYLSSFMNIRYACMSDVMT